MSAKLYLPAEIQAQILLEAFKIIAFPDFWRARAVNSKPTETSRQVHV
jgi:hypothetical protein